MWGPEQAKAFARDGHVTLRGAFDAEAAAAMSEATWRFTAAHSTIDRDDRSTWPTGYAGFSLKKLKRHSSFRAVVENDAVSAALDGIFGAEGWTASRSGAQILFSFPNATPDEWRVPHHLWHMDAPFFRRVDPPRAVKLFAVAEPLPPRGGATMVLAGTPSLVADYARTVTDPAHREGKGPMWNRFMARTDPLLARFAHDDGAPDRNEALAEAFDVGSRRVELRELGGEPGDVHVVHINCFHSASANSLDRPRLLITNLISEAPAPRAATAPDAAAPDAAAPDAAAPDAAAPDAAAPDAAAPDAAAPDVAAPDAAAPDVAAVPTAAARDALRSEEASSDPPAMRSDRSASTAGG